MDQFGMLVESIGFKSQSKSAPLADLKGNNNINNGFSRNSDYNSKTPSNSGDGVFGLKNDQKTQNYNGFDDVFGGLNMYDLDSVFAGSNNSGAKSSGFDNGDDIFGGFQTSKSSDSMNSSYKHNNLNDDLLGGFSDLGSKPNSVNTGKNGTAFDELIPGFGGSSPSSNGTKSEKNSSQHPSDQSAKYNKALVEDPFNIFESSSVQRNSTSTLISDPLSQGARNIPVRSSIDELENFATGRMRSDANESSDTPSPQEVKTSIKATKGRTEARSRQGKEVGEKENKAKQKSVYSGHKETEKRRAQNRVEEDNPASANVDHLESFFSMGSKSRNATSPRSVTEDAVYDTLFQKSKASPDQRFGTSPTIKKNSPKRNVDNDFSFLFGVEVAPSSGAFQEIKGESEERRRARLNHHKNTQDRMAKALNEKNQRDLRLQMEQDERHRLAATLDDRIKRWAAGKEGNLRALLSSLQDVLWPECGWRPVSLTDLITSVSVKKVYQKATLCVHPDKVQQKGANLQQKYIAEKVFDLLKEAYTKFSSEEL